MLLILSPVLLRDLPAVHTLSLSADQHSPTAAVLFPNHASPTSVAHFTAQDEKDMQDPKSTSRHVLVRDAADAGAAAEGKGEVVSYCMWNFFVGRGEGEGKDGGDGGGDGAYYQEWPSDVNREAIEMLMEKARKKREETMGKGDYALLASLCTSHLHRRRGAASQLIRWGLSLADLHHLPVYVESTSLGLPVYLKHGFRQVSTLTVDLRPCGSSHVHDNTILVRPAKAPDAWTDAVMLAPVLTNADLARFPGVEERAFAGTEDGGAQQQQQGSEGGDGDGEGEGQSKPPRAPNFFDLIVKDVDTAKHPPAIHRARALIHDSVTDPTTHYIKAFIPRTNHILGWANYNLCLSPHLRPQPHLWPPGSNQALLAESFGRMDEACQEYMCGKLYALLHVVAVLPEWQRKGVGKQLVGWMVERADEVGVESWLDASKEGLGLYKKFGWREVGETDVDLGKWGGREGDRIRIVSMVREAKGGEIGGGA